ncbi:ferredoxin [Nanobdella aerobiophila]|uniref:Ferredoxin n=1 Tax=Nanobdella aerobiophila TaxID=2586965 RepID=A0A915SG35_9ARCH|nr:ferredoxin [Nanobdella aerobiophila]BBL45854.1 ferredoxin [Nanobdella aerobiophila]
MSKYFIDIDYNKCINCLACYLIDKDDFDIVNNRIKIKNRFISDDKSINNVKKASEACPVNAIYYEEIS